MSTLIRFPAKARPEVLSREQLLRELRAKQDGLVALEQDLYAVAKALWPEDRVSEAPEHFITHRDFDVVELLASIASLHELTDRLMEENEQLRTRLCDLEASHG